MLNFLLDKTFDIVRKYEFVKLIKNQTNLGLGYNRNLAIKNCKNDYIFAIDGDGEYDVNDLPRLLKSVQKGDLVITYRFKKKYSSYRFRHCWH